MKNFNNNVCPTPVWTGMLVAVFLFSCNSSKWVVPAAYVGEWESGTSRITVRTKVKHEPFKFTSDSAIVQLKINGDKTVSGSIGMAEFTKGKLRKNADLPWETGVEYIIECGSVGKIFGHDPLDAKEVEIWFGPLNANGNSDSELRYTQGSAVFPMAHLLFRKVEVR